MMVHNTLAQFRDLGCGLQQQRALQKGQFFLASIYGTSKRITKIQSLRIVTARKSQKTCLSFLLDPPSNAASRRKRGADGAQKLNKTPPLTHSPLKA